MGRPAFSFVDLFAGIGGFHAALSAMGGECVYAVEVDPKAAAVYHHNWGLDPLGDITADANEDAVTVPAHDVLAAGFPCQPFSKSGAQRGMDETRGTLYWNILKIIDKHRPAVVLLENVRNLAGPRHEHEWQVIVETLRDAGYRVSDHAAVFSPHLLPPQRGGRPQVRERVFVTATFDPGGGTDPSMVEPATRLAPVDGWDPKTWDLASDLPLEADHHVSGCDLTAAERHWVDSWDEFVQMMWELREGRRLPGFPLWADSWLPAGSLQVPAATPAWKADFLRKNAEFYTAYRRPIDKWAKRCGLYTDAFPASRRKFEWQAQDTPTLWECVLHFRPSGIRAKRATYLPALVAITQTSVIGSRERRLSTREAARLQGLPDWFTFPGQTDADTYRQLGNGVSVGAVWHVLREHVRRDEDVLKRTTPACAAQYSPRPTTQTGSCDVDTWVSTDRGRHLAGRRRAGTAPEVQLRKALHARGLRFRLQVRLAPRCRPDILLPRWRTAVFVDGCFWHSCPQHGRKTPWTGPNAQRWAEKMQRNKSYDAEANTTARELGWTVVRVWECDVTNDPAAAAARVADVGANTASWPPAARLSTSTARFA